jgi:Holliday junction resolvase-like predicted endonuclease
MIEQRQQQRLLGHGSPFEGGDCSAGLRIARTAGIWLADSRWLVGHCARLDVVASACSWRDGLRMPLRCVCGHGPGDRMPIGACNAASSN